MVTLSENMIHCVYKADISDLEKLIATGDPIAAVDRDGRTALMHAVLAESPSPQMVSTLLRYGVDVNAKDKGQSWAALAFAARSCTPQICRILLDAGADIDATDSFGNTALWRAVMEKKSENVKLLLSRGADPDRDNKKGVSPRAVSERIGFSCFEDRAG